MNMNDFKGTKGVWGMPNHRFIIECKTSSVDFPDAVCPSITIATVNYNTLDNEDLGVYNAALIAASPDLLQACMDFENPYDSSVADCLRVIADILPPKETFYIKWCKEQADIIEAAITKALIVK